MLILGAGRVGQRVAEQLAADNEVTIVDRDPLTLMALRERVDARTLTGGAELPAVLEQAGAAEADIVLAATSLDTVNLAACLVCSERYDSMGVQERIARIRNSAISNDHDLLKLFRVSLSFCPEEIVTESVLGPIRYPGVAHLVAFAGGAAMVAEVVIDKSRAALGRTVAENEHSNPATPYKIVAIERGEKLTVPQPDTRLRHNDRVLLAAEATHIMEAVGQLHSAESSFRRIFIAGGGSIGLRLARKLERDYKVTIIESDRNRCATLSQELSRTLVLQGDATDEALLADEEIDGADFFISVSNRDEINIMASLLARKLGAAHIATLINRESYKSVLDDYAFDVVVSPSDLTIGTLLKHVRERAFEQIHTLSSGAEVMEFIVHSEADKVLGNIVGAIAWPANVVPCMIIRQDEDGGKPQVVIPDEGTVIVLGDRLVIYASSSDLVPQIEDLVSASPLT